MKELAIESGKESRPVNCLLVVCSYHNNNTKKIAKGLAKVLNADIKSPEQVDCRELKEYELIGFGAGIANGRHYKPLLDFADRLPQAAEKKAFIFSTSSFQARFKVDKDHSPLRRKLQAKGYQLIGEFSCKGFYTNSLFKYFGGINKNRPNLTDLKKAEEFALKMRRLS